MLLAWKEFMKGKRKKKDVQEFQLKLMENIFTLHEDLENKTYKHGGYHAFNISDPKPRNIHKASVRDRLLHHSIYRILYPYFDSKFIYDSYSCRLNKGTHKAISRFHDFALKVSKNNTKQCFVLKCDIRKFFASIDHEILIEILNKHIADKDVVTLLENVIDSFNSGISNKGLPAQAGLPLGNLTSQLLVNIYMDEFDKFVKHRLKAKYYIRYADDFVVLSQNKTELENLLLKIKVFLENELKLNLHPDKVFIKTIYSGVDFLGWVNFSNHRVLRTAMKKRMIKKLAQNQKPETMNSYLGLLKWGNSWKLKQKIFYYLF